MTMDSPEEEIVERRPKPKWYVNFADFANMVKAFIGANYLYIAFAFSQAGLVLGIIGTVVIAILTDHCCHLIVKTKHYGIEKMIAKRKKNPQKDLSFGEDKLHKDPTINGDSDCDDGDSDCDENENASLLDQNSCEEEKEHITKNMSYGDVGNLAYGSKGVGMVNFSIALTQFGFCVNYFIFIGNTIHSLFPIRLCYNQNGTSQRICDIIHDSDVKNMNVNFTNILQPMHEQSISSDDLPFLDESVKTVVPNISLILSNVSMFIHNMTTVSPITNATIPWTLVRELEYTAPDLRILVAAPVFVFLPFALFRRVRYLGVISVIANFSILFGCVSVFGFLVHGFEKNESIEMFSFDGFPIFFGMATGAFEGIGLVIPVESSMVGNRHLFPAFLHGAILFLTVVLGCFGILGYLRFGPDTHQMLNTNIPSGNPISTAVNIGICLGILLTFPLQIFPVIEIMEKYLFTEGRICGPRKQTRLRENEALIATADEDHLMVAYVPDSVHWCKRNILRIAVVLVACGLAILLKDYFAYVGAFIGALGSSVLAFILPCLFHLRICWADLNPLIKFRIFDKKSAITTSNLDVMDVFSVKHCATLCAEDTSCLSFSLNCSAFKSGIRDKQKCEFHGSSVTSELELVSSDQCYVQKVTSTSTTTATAAPTTSTTTTTVAPTTSTTPTATTTTPAIQVIDILYGPQDICGSGSSSDFAVLTPVGVYIYDELANLATGKCKGPISFKTIFSGYTTIPAITSARGVLLYQSTDVELYMDDGIVYKWQMETYGLNSLPGSASTATHLGTSDLNNKTIAWAVYRQGSSQERHFYLGGNLFFMKSDQFGFRTFSKTDPVYDLNGFDMNPWSDIPADVTAVTGYGSDRNKNFLLVDSSNRLYTYELNHTVNYNNPTKTLTSLNSVIKF